MIFLTLWEGFVISVPGPFLRNCIDIFSNNMWTFCSYIALTFYLHSVHILFLLCFDIFHSILLCHISNMVWTFNFSWYGAFVFFCFKVSHFDTVWTFFLYTQQLTFFLHFSNIFFSIIMWTFFSYNVWTFLPYIFYKSLNLYGVSRRKAILGSVIIWCWLTDIFLSVLSLDPCFECSMKLLHLIGKAFSHALVIYIW